MLVYLRENFLPNFSCSYILGYELLFVNMPLDVFIFICKKRKKIKIQKQRKKKKKTPKKKRKKIKGIVNSFPNIHCGEFYVIWG